MSILGIDVSTSCIGFTILDDDGNLELMDHFEHKNDFIDLYDFAKMFKYILEIDIKNKYKIYKIFIEEPKKSFASNKTSTNTILLLNRFNGICSWIVYDVFGAKPIHLNESTARKQCGLKILPAKKVGISQKQQAFEQMKEREPFINYNWKFKRTGKIKDYHMDEMDSYIICKAGLMMK